MEPNSSTSKEPRDEAIASSSGTIAYEDFAKLDLRVGEVKSAERVKGSEKLLRLQVDLGEPEARQILAGIGKVYDPKDLVGRSLVVVANLAPRKMMGLESRGMVLAVGDEGTLRILVPEGSAKPGARVS